jgi:hypothetical protein
MFHDIIKLSKNVKLKFYIIEKLNGHFITQKINDCNLRKSIHNDNIYKIQVKINSYF